MSYTKTDIAEADWRATQAQLQVDLQAERILRLKGAGLSIAAETELASLAEIRDQMLARLKAMTEGVKGGNS